MTGMAMCGRRLPVLTAALLLLVGLASPGMATAASTYTEQARLLPAEVGDNDHFGSAVAVDGDTAVAGHFLDDHAGERSGSAYVFVRSGATWTEQAELTASDAAAFDMFGGAVAISGDTVVVGRYPSSRSGEPGAAYVFVRSGSTWTEQSKLTASDGALADSFGFSVAIAGDTIVVGTYHHVNAGSAYVFTRSGTAWSEQAKLTASPAAAGDQFGFSVAIEGDTVVVGARNDDHTGRFSGSAYLFTRSGVTWSEQVKLTASDAAQYDYFGNAVAIAGDTIVVSAPENYEGSVFYGTAYVFGRDGGSWSEQTILRNHGNFGSSLAIENDTLVIGAPTDGERGSISGAAFVFTRSGTAWSEPAKLVGSATARGDAVGSSVAISGDTVLTAGPGGTSTSCCPEVVVVYPGGVYVFERDVDQAPDAEAGPDQLIEWAGGDIGVMLDGSGSSDPDGDILSYSWSGGFQGGSATGITPFVIFNDLGDYEITLTVGDGRGGTDSDTVVITVAAYCEGLPATITGTLGNDLLVGTSSSDVIVALDGNDFIHSDGGNDVVCGGPGADRLRGQGGNDTLVGNDGGDLIVGGSGRDVLIGSDGSDVLKGQGGKDRLYGGGGNDYLFGGGNADRLYGGAGTDYVHGGGATDACSGETMVACE